VLFLVGQEEPAAKTDEDEAIMRMKRRMRLPFFDFIHSFDNGSNGFELFGEGVRESMELKEVVIERIKIRFFEFSFLCLDETYFIRRIDDEFFFQ